MTETMATEWFVYDGRLYEGATHMRPDTLADVGRIIDLLSRGRTVPVAEDAALREAVRAALRAYGVEA